MSYITPVNKPVRQFQAMLLKLNNTFDLKQALFAVMPRLALICEVRNQNTRGNISKISVNQSLKGFLTTFWANGEESKLGI